MYYLYHIPGKKVGITQNPARRITKQQGYSSDEYKIIMTSEDVDFISAQEIALQKAYGYKVDRQTYKQLINSNKMKINVTEQTSTFPCPLNKLKGQLMDNLDLSWETEHGNFSLTKKNIDWILKNARTSMFNPNRCYIYNKAFANNVSKKKKKSKANIYDKIRIWADEKGIYDKGNSHTQYVKLMEEAGELASALLRKDKPEIIDAIGDIVVVLTNLAVLEGLKIENCVEDAYGVIKDRKGKMTNGTFVKEKSTDELINDYVKSTL